MKTIKQEHYGTIEIDNSESDIIQIWCRQGADPQVIQVERDKLAELIKELEKCVK